MMLVDTHVHLQHSKYAGDLDAVLERAAEAGIGKMVVASYDLPASREAVRLAGEVEGCYAAVGIHPHSAGDVTPEVMEKLESLAAAPRVVAVGETGLDYHYMYSPREAQLAALEAHLVLSERLGKPVIIHDREAHDDMLAALAGYPVDRLGGVWHCFSGDLSLAERIMDKGWYLGIGGIVTFSKELAEIVRHLPLERIVLETDAPYLAPAPHRGQRNEPAWTAIIAARVAAIKETDAAVVAQVTSANAAALFRI